MSTSLIKNLKILSLYLLANNLYPFYIKTITKYQKQINYFSSPYRFYYRFSFFVRTFIKNPRKNGNFLLNRMLRFPLSFYIDYQLKHNPKDLKDEAVHKVLSVFEIIDNLFPFV